MAKLFNAGDQVPVTELLEVIGKADSVAPEQIGETAVNVGVIFGFTTTVNGVETAHCPVAGAKVYVVVAKLFNAGDQVPITELFEVVGKADSVAPEQICATEVNVGVTLGFTTIVNGVETAHCPVAGAKVYVVVAKLFNTGAHVPVTELLDVVGKGDSVAPEQIGATAVKVGVTFGFTTIVNGVATAHCPVEGVKI